MAVLAIDFGTSNSSVATLVDGEVRRIHIEANSETLPTSVFFDFDDNIMLFGTMANQSLLNGAHGRYMRSLKSVLGTSLMAEKRMIIGKKYDFYDIISSFLTQLKHRAEQSQGVIFDSVMSGRPVNFHSDDEAKNQRAEQDLRECYLRAGFKTINFMFEPEAAAFACAKNTDRKSLGLIVDIGGGTSDYCLFESGNNDTGKINILASHGVRLGGTNFDKILNLEYFMPFLGMHGQLQKIMSEGIVAAPQSIFHDLATWEKISFCYTPELKNTVRELERQAFEPLLFKRLANLIEHRNGHELAFLAEKTKISANELGEEVAKIDLGLIETGLYVGVTGDDLQRIMADACTTLKTSVLATLSQAGCQPNQVDEVIYVGGSSQMRLVQNQMRQLFPQAKFKLSSVFTAVVDGLALGS